MTLPPEHIPTSALVSDVLLKGADEEKRVFEGWGTVEIKDRQGDLIPIEAFQPLMKKLMKRGAPILDSHSNRHVGKVLSYKFKKKNGKDGLYLKGEIFDDFSSDDAVWRDIKLGLISGFSLGGRAQKQEIDCSYEDMDECVNKIEDLEVWEWSVVRKPANPEATIESVNKLAKSALTKKMSWDECVSELKPEYGERVYEVCNGLAAEGKVEPCPETKMLKDMKKAILEYLKFQDINGKKITQLDAQALLEKCTHCKRYVDLAKSMGIDENNALLYLQKKLDSILEEKHKMSVNVKVQQPEAPTQPEEEKQEEPQAQDMQAVLEEIMKRLAAIEDVVFPKETSDVAEEAKDEASPKPAVSPETMAKVVETEIKKYFDEKLGVSSTPRTLEKNEPDKPEEPVDLTKLSFADLNKLRFETDRHFRKKFESMGMR
jgi:HK97 family phage prohead protease